MLKQNENILFFLIVTLLDFLDLRIFQMFFGLRFGELSDFTIDVMVGLGQINISQFFSFFIWYTKEEAKSFLFQYRCQNDFLGLILGPFILPEMIPEDRASSKS